MVRGITRRLSQGNAGSSSRSNETHRILHCGTRGQPVGSARGTRFSLELQLQRRIARLSRTPACPIVTQSGRHLAPPCIGILRRLRFGWLRRCCRLQSFPRPASGSGGLVTTSCGGSSTTNLATTDLGAKAFCCSTLAAREMASRLTANCCSLASYASGSIRLAESSWFASAGTSGSNLGFMKERSGPGEPPAAERLQCGELVPRKKSQSPKN